MLHYVTLIEQSCIAVNYHFKSYWIVEKILRIFMYEISRKLLEILNRIMQIIMSIINSAITMAVVIVLEYGIIMLAFCK